MRALLLLFCIPIMVGCTTLAPRDPLNIDVAGIEPLPGEGLEMRMAVKIRVQNPNEGEVRFTGTALTLYLNDNKLGTGVSDQSGSVPRFGETVISIPVSISAFSAAQQLFGIMGGTASSDLTYRVTGKLVGDSFKSLKFSGEGKFQIPGTENLPTQ